MDILLNVVLPLALAFIMFSLGLGLTPADFTRVLKHPTAFFVGAFGQMILLPLVAFAVVILFGLNGALAVGVMILAACPGGVTSNVISKLANADVALSVTLTAVISLTSVVTVPLLLSLSVQYFQGSEAIDVDITSTAIALFLITVVPILLGLALRHIFTEPMLKAEPVISRIAMGLFILIVIAALASGWATFLENLPRLGPALILLNIVMLALGFGLARLTGRSKTQSKTIAIETGIQNSTLGIAVGAMLTGAATGLSDYVLPAAVYGITMYIVTLPLAYWLREQV